MALRNVDLLYWYIRINKRFFNNNLPIIPVRFRKTKYRSSHGETDIAIGSRKPIEIRIEPALKNRSRWAVAVLLHEMCHVSNAVTYRHRCGHGPKFTKEIERLCKEGAFTRYNGGIL